MNDKKMRKKIPKLRSKKGLSLVELIVGVTIMAMAISSAAGAIVTGYKTTIDNAIRNEAAAKCASVNEVIMKAVKNCDFYDADEAKKYFFEKTTGEGAGATTVSLDPNTNADDSVYQAGKAKFSDLYYNSSTVFPDEAHDLQYQIDINAVENLTADGVEDIAMKGIKIKTAINVPDGYVEIFSFVPYFNQD